MLISIAYGALWIALLAYGIHARTANRWAGRLGTAAALAAWAALTAGLTLRGLQAGHWPLTNAYEFALCFTWAILGVHLLLEASSRDRRPGSWIMAFALVTATYAISRPAEQQIIWPLLPALRSVWLQLHVLTAAIGYGAFGVAAGIAAMQLFAKVMPAEAVQATNPGLKRRVEHGMERVVGLGFPFLTLSILTGAIWAQSAWGRYWGWDPKETWALITWLWYLLILHVRPLRKWRGRRLAALVLGGFVVVGFTFIGVPWLVRTVRLESLHGF